MYKERIKKIFVVVFAVFFLLSGISGGILYLMGSFGNNVQYVKYSIGCFVITYGMVFIYGLYNKQKITYWFFPVIIGLIYTYLDGYGGFEVLKTLFTGEGTGYLILQHCNWM